MSFRGTAVVTGASSGIGAATVVALAQDGWRVVAGARREDRLREVAEVAGARWARLDVTDQASVDAFVAGLDECAVLVEQRRRGVRAGPIAEADADQWRRMYEVNVLGLMRMTRALLPLLERRATADTSSTSARSRGRRPTPAAAATPR